MPRPTVPEVTELRFTYAGRRWYALWSDGFGWVINLASPRLSVFWDSSIVTEPYHVGPWRSEIRVPGGEHVIGNYPTLLNALDSGMSMADALMADTQDWPEGIPKELTDATTDE